MHFIIGLCISTMAIFGYAFNIRNTEISSFRSIRNIIDNRMDPVVHQMNNHSNSNKLIISSPGGLAGFYFMGISSYIKQNYALDDYVFSGASAGAWNSLFLSLRKNEDERAFVKEILNTDLKNLKSVIQLEKRMKSTILNSYNDDSFHLDKLYLGVSVLEHSAMNLRIYNDFSGLEDAIECCIASSHIPFVTGGACHIYRNKLSFDGGFYSYPYLNSFTPSLIITPDIWTKNKNKGNVTVIDCNIDSMLNLKKTPPNMNQLYESGYDDAMKNKAFLDSIFLKNDKECT